MPVANPSIMFRRKDIYDVGLFDENYNKSEDFELWLRFLGKNKKMYNIQESLVYYRTTKNANQKRGRQHYINYYKALKKNSKNIWPINKRIISLIFFYIVSLLPNYLLNIFLNMKVIKSWKNIIITK